MKGHARNVMTERVTAVGPDTPLEAVARILVAGRFGGVPVVGPDGKVLGVLSEKDLMTALLQSSNADRLARAVELVGDALAAERKVLLFGNGGSAADAQHITAEFVGRFARERRALPALALTTATSALTAIANDYGYEHVFARQVHAL